MRTLRLNVPSLFDLCTSIWKTSFLSNFHALILDRNTDSPLSLTALLFRSPINLKVKSGASFTNLFMGLSTEFPFLNTCLYFLRWYFITVLNMHIGSCASFIYFLNIIFGKKVTLYVENIVPLRVKTVFK